MNRLTIRGTALALVIFFDLTFTLCVLWGLALPRIHAKGVFVLEAILPGFTWLSPQSFVLGLALSTLYALYIALIFVPLFNYFEGRWPAEVGGRAMGQPREAAHHP